MRAELAVARATGLGFNFIALGYPLGWVSCTTLLHIRYRGSELGRRV